MPAATGEAIVTNVVAVGGMYVTCMAIAAPRSKRIGQKRKMNLINTEVNRNGIANIFTQGIT